MSKIARQILLFTIVVLLLGSVLAQILVPLFASSEGVLFPEVAGVAGPYSVVAILVIACGQIALIATWRLLALIGHEAIFTRRALRWVDIITACGAIATVLSAAGIMHLLGVVRVGGPAVALALPACLATGLFFVTLMVVIRGLLESAIRIRSDLDGVI